jgi:hypothetical protein
MTNACTGAARHVTAEPAPARSPDAAVRDADEVLVFDGFESGDMSATNRDGFRWAQNNRTSVVTMAPGPKVVWHNGPRSSVWISGWPMLVDVRRQVESGAWSDLEGHPEAQRSDLP